jgi:hypothetical protein
MKIWALENLTREHLNAENSPQPIQKYLIMEEIGDRCKVVFAWFIKYTTCMEPLVCAHGGGGG